ncbi:unnamed protein product [Owenia fusiformis]|uniref:AP-1 complex-associated regulatory protein n=1 Tax=Owenia fusiformis TaxID=6347 RepID=A0A8S4PKJ0_OWEFU|nr:unnamed protein product [Owenia fusiformis]
MGNCCAKCLGKLDKRKYLRTRYNVERTLSIEFENLMDEEGGPQDENPRPVNERERLLLSERQYDTIVHEQLRIDAEIEQKLNEQEEAIRYEEEAYYEAKREASRIAKIRRDEENKINANNLQNQSNSWLGDQEEEWEVAGGEDDFEMFLESVRARSINTRRQQLQNEGTQDSTSNCSSSNTKEASSIELEWEHEQGVDPSLPKQPRSRTEEELAKLTHKNKQTEAESPTSNDLEWDNDFVQSDTIETQQLLTNRNPDRDNNNETTALPER